jgi:hypothetical protein
VDIITGLELGMMVVVMEKIGCRFANNKAFCALMIMKQKLGKHVV